ncbi:MAG: hypothetical protein AAF804_06430 [Bacteroidota bacterium]
MNRNQAFEGITGGLRFLLWLSLWMIGMNSYSQTDQTPRTYEIGKFLRIHQLHLEPIQAAIETICLERNQGRSTLTWRLTAPTREAMGYRLAKQQIGTALENGRAPDPPELAQALGAYVQLAGRIDHQIGLIDSHLGKKLYQQDEGAFLDAALHRLVIMMEDQSSLQNELYFYLDRISPSVAVRSRPTQRALMAFRPLLMRADDLLRAVRHGQLGQVRRARSQFEAHLSRLRLQREEWMDPLTNSQQEILTLHWDSLIQAAENWLLVVEQFLSGNKVPQDYLALGWAYYAYHRYLKSAFDEGPSSLVGRYNLLLEDLGRLAVPRAGTLPWLKLLDTPEAVARPCSRPRSVA